MSPTPDTRDPIQMHSSDNPHEVAQHLDELQDLYESDDALTAQQTVHAPAHPDNVSSKTETSPHKGNTSWLRKLGDRAKAKLTGEAGYYHVKYGNYVYDPETGKTEYEFVPLYVRIGMHTLFCGREQENLLEDGHLRGTLLRQSEREGRHFDDPRSVANI
ncbi:hypothetical protein HDV00_010607, partial [Rhizophlyctis rosea]